MNIAEIPFPEIREKAIKRLNTQRPSLIPRYHDINQFVWKKTYEGHYFWKILYDFLVLETKSIRRNQLEYITEKLNENT